MPDGRVIVIGGGGTGAAVVHDLALRGIEAVLLERGELISGTTGRHHGQLHCGARYAVHDPDIAVPCREESAILRRIAPASIEFNYGLFVAVSDEDASYRDTFLTACQTCGIPARGLTRSEALRMEPGLNPDIRLAVLVPDGTIDAWRLPMQFLATARRNGADIRSFCEVVGLESTGGRVRAVRVRDRRGDSEYELEADVVVNAGGPWVGRIAGMARIPIDVTPAPGVLVAVKGRLANMVISRLHPVADGDIIVPQRNLCIIGSTQWQTRDLDRVEIPDGHVQRLLELGPQPRVLLSGPRERRWRRGIDLDPGR